MSKKTVKARVLTQFKRGEGDAAQVCEVNSVVELDEDEAKSLGNLVDTSAGAVAYAEKIAAQRQALEEAQKAAASGTL